MAANDSTASTGAHTKRYRRAAWAFVGLFAMLTACTAAGDKSGVKSQPIELVLASNDGQNDGIPAVAQFVDQISALSGGRVRVTVKYSWSGAGYDEPGLIRDVAAGRADLGWSGTRAFDLVGVNAFRPLHAPMLVTSLAAEKAIIDDPLTRTLLTEMQPAGVVGLALLADEIRHPVGVAKPLLAPQDFRGLTFQSFPSGAQADGIRALGATPTTDPVRPLAQTGELGGFESMWNTLVANGYPDIAPYVTANVGLWPRTTVLFANPAALTRLDTQVRGWIVAAADNAAHWSTLHAFDGQDYQIGQACGEGARLVTATESQSTALRKAAEPVYQALRADPALGPTLAQIEELVAAAPADPAITVPAGCAYQPGEEAEATTTFPAPTAPGDPGQLPQGLYRFSTTEDFLLGKGASATNAFINAGVWTWTLDHGRWHSKQEAIDPSVDKLVCDGYYDVRGTSVAFTRTTYYTNGDCAPLTWTATWSATADALTWTDVSVTDGFEYMWAPRPWKKIG